MTKSGLRETVQKWLLEYAQQNGISAPKLSVTSGSKNGDSYSGEVYRVKITEENQELNDGCTLAKVSSSDEKTLQFIVKLPPITQFRRQQYNSAKHFSREHYVYDKIIPAFEEFQRISLINPTENKPFLNYPKVYAASSKFEDEYVILEDLSQKNYQNMERPVPLSFDKCSLVLTNLAKLHAISFAFKDQQIEQFNKLMKQISEIIFVDPINQEFNKFLTTNAGYVISTLTCDGNVAEEVIEKCKSFGLVYGNSMVDCCSVESDIVLLHGDCWISNMMFKKTEQNEMKFLDWQVARYGSIAIDLSYFIFCCTDAELRIRLPELLAIYHTELVKRIDQLGSNGLKIFPMEKLLFHMKNYARFGLGMAMMTLHATCATDMIDVQTNLELNMSELDDLALPMLKNPIYQKRIVDVCKDFVRFGYL